MTSSPHPITMRRLATVSAIASTIALSACVNLHGPRLVTDDPPPIPDAGAAVPSSSHAVLENGQQVMANTAAGKMKIEAGPGLRRVFDWDGLRRGAIVTPRSTSFAGGQTTGLTFDGTPNVWADANGITKLRYEEGDRHFQTMDDAMIWMQIRRLYYTYDDNGLVLGWRREGNTLHAELWQFYIDGSKPTTMPDSQNRDIVRGPLEVVPQKMYPHLVFDDGHTEPYNTETASQYKGRGSSPSQTSQCNWFQRLFHKCPAPAPTPAEDNAGSSAPEATSTPATANSATPANGASSPINGSTTSDNGTQPAADSQASPPADTSAPQATIAGNVVNVRSRASTSSDVLLKARQGDSVTILKQDRGWRYVQFKDGRKGWVADFLLKH